MAIEIGLIVAAIYLIISLFRGTKNRNKERDAIEILKERYARGEISEEEYLERKKRLEEKWLYHCMQASLNWFVLYINRERVFYMNLQIVRDHFGLVTIAIIVISVIPAL